MTSHSSTADDADSPHADPSTPASNVAYRLDRAAKAAPQRAAVIVPRGIRGGKQQYQQHSFAELATDSTHIALGLLAAGFEPGQRAALMVRPGFDFISLVFALLKSGVVSILIDPGMGRRRLLKCLDDVEPEGFIGIPLVQAIRAVLRRRYPQATKNVTVGKRLFWGGPTLDMIRASGRAAAATGKTCPAVRPDDPAAIIFTTGSTGPPKGVLYGHRQFSRQVEEIGGAYGIAAGEIDVACFPLFALFNAALGVTTVFPQMDFSRPAAASPEHIVGLIRDLGATQSFASPAVWKNIGTWCQSQGQTMPSLRRVLSAGAPVAANVLRLVRDAIPPANGDGNCPAKIHTPYGATEALPVASIEASEVLNETAAATAQGAGVCVGRRFPGIAWKVIRIFDGPLPTMASIEPLPAGEIGELIVTGDVVTRQYVLPANFDQANAGNVHAQRANPNELGKIIDGDRIWHRMGDVGYLDGAERFWFCGRMAHRVSTPRGELFTIPCEAIFNTHPAVARTALVGVGPRGAQQPVLVVEPHATAQAQGRWGWQTLLHELKQIGSQHPLTSHIHTFLPHKKFPVDIRHNAKIFREKLAVWAEGVLKQG